MKRIAVFASGYGSNFQAIVENSGISYEVDLLISDCEDSYAVKRAHDLGIQSFVFNPKCFQNKNSYEEIIVKKLQEHNVDYLALAGYMRIIGPILLNAFPNKIINIHPSLLPAFKGIDAILQAFEYGVKVTGVTVHFVESGIDTGRIIEQIPLVIKNEMTYKELESEIHAIEHKIYPKVLNDLLREDS